MVFAKLIVSSAGTLLAFGLYRLLGLLIGHFTSPLRDLPGPKSGHWLYGNLKELIEDGESVVFEQWVAKYGPTIRYKSFVNMNHLFTVDTKAVNYILMNADSFQKSERVRSSLSRFFGEGVLVAEGDNHRKQRKIMNPAFGHAQIRELTEIFVEKSIQLRDIWLSDVTKNGVEGSARIDVLPWLSWTTLDVIGLAGFNYSFNALNMDGKRNELSDAFSTIFGSAMQVTIFTVIKKFLPLGISRIIPSKRDAQLSQAHDSMTRIGAQLLRESKAAVSATTSERSASVEKNSVRARDLLSLLVRANMAEDLPDNQRLDDADVLAQVPTFIVAGHETTSAATAWALYALTQNKTIETKLRNELLSVYTNNPTMDELNALPYLDSVVRETLRVYAPAPLTTRIAMNDDVLPLNIPYMDKKGVRHNGIKVSKGDMLMIPILALNKNQSLWGEDATEFKPERWVSVPEAVSSIPGVWGNMLTFLGGPRACIGYRFALLEMKALLFTLVRAFEFELAVPAKDIIKKAVLVDKPAVLTDPEGGTQLPLFIKPYTRA